MALNKGSEGYPIVYQRYTASLQENDVNDIFGNVLLLVTLGDRRALDIFPGLREKFKNDANALKAVNAYEAQLNASLQP